MAQEFLSQREIPFTDLDVTKDQEALEEMIKISGGRSVPVIVVCEQVMVGFDAGWLEQAPDLHETTVDGLVARVASTHW